MFIRSRKEVNNTENQDRIYDLAQRVSARDIPLFTHFLDLSQQKQSLAAAKAAGVSIKLFGGREGEGAENECERKIACFFTDTAEDALVYPIDCIYISSRSAHFTGALTHRDVLGSLMSLGIDRMYLGDIAVRENGAFLFCEKKQSGYIIENLHEIGGGTVDCRISQPPEGPLRKVREVILQVSSPRADALISRLFSISREEAASLVLSSRVTVDDEELRKSDRLLSSGQVLSVRGHGRARYCGEVSISRKGKLNVKMLLYS